MSTLTVTDRPRLTGWRGYIRDLWDRREFAWFLAMGNLKARNASTALGLFWWVLNPLIMSAVYFLVFGFLFPRDPTDEPALLAWILSGLFAFNFTTTAMSSGANSILSNAKLLVNIRFPRMILPISGLAEVAVGFLASLSIFYFIAWPVDAIRPTLHLFLLPAVFVIHVIFNLGLASLLARLAIPFRDINNLIPHLNRLLLYLSPIIWPLAFLERQSEGLQTAMRVANPPIQPVEPLSDRADGSRAGRLRSLGSSCLGQRDRSDRSSVICPV